MKSGKRKGIKLDFKSTEVVEEAYKVLPELVKEVSQQTVNILNSHSFVPQVHLPLHGVIPGILEQDQIHRIRLRLIHRT